MKVYSTCRDCGGLLHATDGETVHPSCTPKPTKMERLQQDWLDSVNAGDMQIANDLQTVIDKLNNQPPRLLDAALAYTNRGWGGWPVFPLAPVGYTDPRHPDYIGTGKKPYPGSRGFKDANTDPKQIIDWWTRHPDSNIGLPTGHQFDVIDIDVPDGPMSYTRMLEDDLIPDVHGQVATSSGGLHLYVKPSGGGNLTRIAPGIDYRGLGGYVVAPPSTLGERGRAWTWITKPSPVITGVGDTFGASV